MTLDVNAYDAVTALSATLTIGVELRTTTPDGCRNTTNVLFTLSLTSTFRFGSSISKFDIKSSDYKIVTAGRIVNDPSRSLRTVGVSRSGSLLIIKISYTYMRCDNCLVCSGVSEINKLPDEKGAIFVILKFAAISSVV